MDKELKPLLLTVVIMAGLIAGQFVSSSAIEGAAINELILLFILSFVIALGLGIVTLVIGGFFVMLTADIFAAASGTFLLARRRARLTAFREELEPIIGDLREEFSGFSSKSKAYVWLAMQIVTSAVPILCKSLKSSFSSRLGK